MDTIPDVALKKYDKAILAVMAVAGLLAVGGLGYGLYLILPMLVEMAKDTVIFFGLLFVAAFMLVIAAQMFMARDAVFMKMKMIARSLRRSIIVSDPIGALDVAIGRFRQRMSDAEEKQMEAEAATARLEKQIRHPDHKQGVRDQEENELRLAQMAERAGKSKADVDLHYVAAERWKRAAEVLEPMLAKQKAREARIEEAHQMAIRGLSNLTTQKQVYSIQLDAIKAEASQAKSFRKFFGASAELETIDMAVEEIEKQSAQAEAEIVSMLRSVDPLIEREKLQNEADADAARARIAANAAQKTLPEAVPQTGIIADLTKDRERDRIKR